MVVSKFQELHRLRGGDRFGDRLLTNKFQLHLFAPMENINPIFATRKPSEQASRLHGTRSAALKVPSPKSEELGDRRRGDRLGDGILTDELEFHTLPPSVR
jgi:hypothetical protein